MVDPLKMIIKLDQCRIWIYFKQVVIFVFFLQYFIWEFLLWFYILYCIIQRNILKTFKSIIWLQIGFNLIFKTIRSNCITRWSKMRMTMNRKYIHYYFSVKNTTLEHQVLNLFYHMSLYVQEGLQRVSFLTIEKLIVKLWLLIIEKFLHALVGYFNRFLEYTDNFFDLKKISFTYLTQCMDNLYVSTIVYWNVPYVLLCVKCRLFFYWLQFCTFDQRNWKGCTIS